jgi:hypothetical protein
MKDWYSSIYKAFIVASVISFLISFFSSGTVSLNASIAGYSTLILGIMMILIILFQGILKVNSNQSLLQVFFSIFISTGPFILILAVIGFVLYLIINYKNLIIDQHVSQSYYTFSNITIILLLLQLYIVYTNITSERFESTGKLSKLTSSVIYLLGVLTSICSIILFTILKYYTTDGFQNVYLN